MSKNDKEQQPKQRATKYELDKRIVVVSGWILEGHSHSVIKASCVSTWKLTDRQAANYYKAATDKIQAETKEDLKERLAFHLAARRKLYNELTEKKKPQGVRAALDILKDIAMLEGLYIGKGTGSGGGSGEASTGPQLHDQVIETTMVLK